MDYFAELGHRIERQWARVDRDEERFAELAAAELQSFAPAPDLPEQIASRFLDSRQQARRQLAGPDAFGEPGITAYFGRGFVIDVYFWNNAIPAIHNHPFCGCFTLLRGISLHDVYRFELHGHLGAGIRFGELRPQALSLLRPGTVVPFSLVGLPLIHSLVHVPNPSVSMVIRTVRTLEYFRFFPPSLALTMAEPDDLVSRQIQLLGWMQAAGHADYLPRLRAFMLDADFETTFRLVSALYAAGKLELMIELARKRHGRHAESIVPAIESALRLQRENQFREQITDPNARMVASILMCAHDRRDVFSLLRQACPDEAPSVALACLADFEPDPAAFRQALARLLSGDDSSSEWGGTIFRALLVK